MRRYVGLTAVLLALCIAAITIGCTSGGGKKAATTVVPSVVPTQTPGTPPDLGATAEELRSLAARYGTQEAKTTYDVSAGINSSPRTGTATLYWKPDAGWRLDFDLKDATGTLLKTADAAYVCTVTKATGSCRRAPAAENASVAFLQVLTDPPALLQAVQDAFYLGKIERSQREIAGQQAACFSLQGTASDRAVSVDYCFAADGKLLSLKSSGLGANGSGELKLDATQVGAAVTDADLQPPYPIAAQ